MPRPRSGRGQAPEGHPVIPAPGVLGRPVKPDDDKADDGGPRQNVADVAFTICSPTFAALSVLRRLSAVL